MTDEQKDALPKVWIFTEGNEISGYTTEDAEGNGVDVSDHHLYVPAERIRERIAELRSEKGLWDAGGVAQELEELISEGEAR